LGKLLSKVCKELSIENFQEIVPNIKMIKSQRKKCLKDIKLTNNLTQLMQECLENKAPEQPTTKDIWRWVRSLLEGFATQAQKI